jgi:hypothetical protein
MFERAREGWGRAVARSCGRQKYVQLQETKEIDQKKGGNLKQRVGLSTDFMAGFFRSIELTD